MANVKISQLPSLSTMTDLAQIPVVAGGTTYQITGANLNSYFNSGSSDRLVNGSQEVVLNVDGSVTYPTLTVTRGDTPSGTLTGQTLLFGDNSQEAIISTPNGDANVNISSQRLVINPGKGAPGSGGEGGDIYLWAGQGGDTNGSGGDIKLRGGYGPAGGAGGYVRIDGGDSGGSGQAGFIELTGGTGGDTAGGYIRILGGQGTSAGGDANITGGVGAAGPGGNVNITGGTSSNGLAEYGNINLAAGASTWTFDNTGAFTAPGNITATNLITNNIRSDDSSFVNIEDGVNITGDVVASGNITSGNISTGIITLTNGAVIKDNAGDSVAFGQSAGGTSQGNSSVALGQNAGATGQGTFAVAIGRNAGQTTQGGSAVAVGVSAGDTSQGTSAVAIGSSAGFTNQSANTVAVGVGAGQSTQGVDAVAIGNAAGSLTQGIAAVAIGTLAGRTFQANNSIIINATGANLDQTTANTFTVAPVRNDVANIGQVVFYNTTSKEITYGNVISVAGNITGGNLTTAGLTSTASLSITGNTATITTANYSVGYLNIPQISFAANATAALVDSGKHYYTTSASNLALTLADNSAVSWPVGTALSIVNRGTANVTVAPADGVSLYLAGNATTGNRTVTTYGMATVMNVASNVWMISGTVV